MEEHPVDHYGKRVVAVVIGLVIGLVVGLVGGALVVGFGDPLIATAAVTTIAMAVLAWFKPEPFLFLVGLISGIF